MKENYCDYEPLTSTTVNKITCPPRLEKGFKEKDNCMGCTKTRNSSVIPHKSEGQFYVKPKQSDKTTDSLL